MNTVTERQPLSQAEVVSWLNDQVQFGPTRGQAVEQPMGFATSFQLRKSANGSYKAVPVEKVERPLSAKNERPSKFSDFRIDDPILLLRDFFQRGQAWRECRDEDIVSAAAQAATESNLQPSDARTLARAVFCGIACRGGIGHVAGEMGVMC